jgi:hypothetical protein
MLLVIHMFVFASFACMLRLASAKEFGGAAREVYLLQRKKGKVRLGPKDYSHVRTTHYRPTLDTDRGRAWQNHWVDSSVREHTCAPGTSVECFYFHMFR